jgi:PPM family protein phosphatase
MAKVESSGITDVGKKRKANEDSFFVDDGMSLYVVADGMGGHKAGEVASRVVVETVRDSMRRFRGGEDADKTDFASEGLSPSANQLVSSIHLANQTVFQLSQTNVSMDGMGSTVSIVYLSGRSIIAANVGDSPIYLIRASAIQTISTPHTYVAELAALDPSAAEKLSDAYRHMITRGMGLKEDVQPDVNEIKAEKGDRLVICSDGLSDLVEPEEIMAAIDGLTPDQASGLLVDMANDRGGKDNITVIVLQLGPPSAKSGTTAGEPAEKRTRTAGEPVPVDIDTEDASHSSQIQLDGATGGFVETNDAYTIGEELSLTFADPTGNGYLIVDGTVSGRSPGGIDITFEELNDDLKQKLSALK